MNNGIPKLQSELTVADLMAHRWCVYHNDDEGFDGFEHAIPDSHPDFSKDVIEIELAKFTFANGAVAWGLFDGCYSFKIMLGSEIIRLWSGLIEPDPDKVSKYKEVLSSCNLIMPVKAETKWSSKTELFHGIKFIQNDKTREVLL